MENKEPNRYTKILEAIFARHYEKGVHEIAFERTEFSQVAEELGITLPKNLGDVLYSFRYRTLLPKSITSKAPKGYEWIIRPAGKGKYKLVIVKESLIVPSSILAETKIPDATPGVIATYALSDEQSLLAKLRYNRLVDIFTGLTCYSLQSHLRTTLRDGSQVETDEIYIGLDKRGAHYVLPIQAKGGRDKIGIVQIEQDFELCSRKFPSLVCHELPRNSWQRISSHYLNLNRQRMGSELLPRSITDLCDLTSYRLRNCKAIQHDRVETEKDSPFTANL